MINGGLKMSVPARCKQADGDALCAGAGVSSSAAFVCSSALAVLAAYGVSATKAVRVLDRASDPSSDVHLRAGAGLSSSSSCVCAGALAAASVLCHSKPLTKRVRHVRQAHIVILAIGLAQPAHSSSHACCSERCAGGCMGCATL